MTLKMKEFPMETRPDEKLMRFGADSLSDAELVAVIIRNGIQGKSSVDVALDLLKSNGNSLLGLCSANISDMKKIPGIGKVKAIQLKALTEISRRISRQSYPVTKALTSPGEIADYYMEDLRHREREVMVLACFDAKGHLIKDEIISEGTVSGAYSSPREIFIKALEFKAVYIVLLHNHPSGDPTPSNQDISFTLTVKNLGKTMEIPLIDHIIIGDQRYVSLKEQNLM